MKGAPLSVPEREQRFREGVEALFDIWDALLMMKTEMVAGRDTLEIVEDMFEGVLEQFTFGPKGKAKVSQSDLEDMFFDFTSRDLYTVLEDGSVEQVADYCFQLFRTLQQDDLTVYGKVRAAAAKKKTLPAQKHTVLEPVRAEPEAVVAAEGNDNIGDDAGGDSDSGEGDDSEEEGAAAAAAAEEEEKNEGGKKKNEPDEDGWVTVGKKK
jgi:hypothetical protein